MKKSLIFSAALVAALALVSCSKESADSIALPEGKIVSFTLDVPGERDIADMDSEDVKISFGDLSDNKIPVYWNSGDAFRLFTCLAESEYSIDTDGKTILPSKTVTDCGDFTTSDNGVSSATFSGVIPAGALSDAEGFAIFPATAPKSGSCEIGYSDPKFYIGCTTEIPAEQDGTGMRYLLATSRLKNGVFSKFVFSTNMVKINIPEGLGIDKVILSAPTSYTKALGGNQIRLYYYFPTVTCSLSNTKGQIWSIAVNRGGEELSGDIYFVVRNTDAWTATNNAMLTLTFHKGTQVSKPMTAKMKAMSGGKMLDYGQITPVFGEQTIITYDRSVLQTPDKAFIPVGEEERFPCAISSSSPYQLSIKSDYSEMDYTWYNSEHTYTFGGYEWTFGSTKTFDAGYNVTGGGNKGMFFYTGKTSCNLRIESGGAYIKLPVVPGKKLVAMSISIANAASQVWWKIAKDKEGKAFLSGASSVEMSKSDGLKTIVFTDTEVDTAYYLISAGALQPVKWDLIYQ